MVGRANRWLDGQANWQTRGQTGRRMGGQADRMPARADLSGTIIEAM